MILVLIIGFSMIDFISSAEVNPAPVPTVKVPPVAATTAKAPPVAVPTVGVPPVALPPIVVLPPLTAKDVEFIAQFIANEELLLSEVKKKVRWYKPRESESELLKSILHKEPKYAKMLKNKPKNVGYDMVDKNYLMVFEVKGDKNKWMYPRILITTTDNKVSDRVVPKLFDILDKKPFANTK